MRGCSEERVHAIDVVAHFPICSEPNASTPSAASFFVCLFSKAPPYYLRDLDFPFPPCPTSRTTYSILCFLPPFPYPPV